MTNSIRFGETGRAPRYSVFSGVGPGRHSQAALLPLVIGIGIEQHGSDHTDVQNELSRNRSWGQRADGKACRGGYAVAILGSKQNCARGQKRKITIYFNKLNGAPETIRTSGLCLRRANDDGYCRVTAVP